MKRCDDKIKKQYRQAEEEHLPIIKTRARRLRWNGPIDFDDAVQEGRIALLSSIAHGSFDPKRGTAEAFISKVMENTYNSLMASMLAKSRMPHVMVWDGAGWAPTPMRPESLDELSECFHPSATSSEEALIEQERARMLCQFKERLAERLSAEERKVFEARLDLGPDGASNVELCRRFNMTKNQIDWILSKIRLKFMDLVGEFSEIWGTQEESIIMGRPLVHTSAKWNDAEFVRTTAIRRGLTLKNPKIAIKEGLARKLVVIQYAWGAIVMGCRAAKHFTIVVEGRFNPNTGEVAGTGRIRVRLPIQWYNKLIGELRKNEWRGGQNAPVLGAVLEK